MSTVSKTLIGLGHFVRVISCDFVDRFSRSVTGDPRNHTKKHEQENDSNSSFGQSLCRGCDLTFLEQSFNSKLPGAHRPLQKLIDVLDRRIKPRMKKPEWVWRIRNHDHFRNDTKRFELVAHLFALLKRAIRAAVDE